MLCIGSLARMLLAGEVEMTYQTCPLDKIMVALYITQDSFGTACNISGDNAIGIVVDSIYKKFILKEDTVEA